MKSGRDGAIGRGKNPEGKRYKKKGRDRSSGEGQEKREEVLGQKRSRLDGEEASGGKKGRTEEKEGEVVVTDAEEVQPETEIISAGLLEQPRREQ